VASACNATAFDDDDKFTPTKHLTPPPHHSSSRPAAAHTETETPLLHQKRGVGPVMTSSTTKIFFALADSRSRDLGACEFKECIAIPCSADRFTASLPSTRVLEMFRTVFVEYTTLPVCCQGLELFAFTHTGLFGHPLSFWPSHTHAVLATSYVFFKALHFLLFCVARMPIWPTALAYACPHLSCCIFG